MSNTTSLPSYTELSNTLSMANSAFQAADAHGLLCGVICATSGQLAHWEKLILGNKKDEEAAEALRQLYEVCFHQMSEFSFEFTLLLPEDTSDINFRTETLGLWCQGFLTGLNQSKIPIEEITSPEVSDALNDIMEVAQVAYGEIPDTDEDETAYYELVEYVRLVVLMIYHEFKGSPNVRDDNDDLLH